MRTGLAITLGVLIGFALLTTPASASFAIQSPTLDPGFRGQSMDYVVDCPTRVPLTVRSDRHGVARIGAGRDFTGRRTKRVALDQGQAIKITRERGGRTSIIGSAACRATFRSTGISGSAILIPGSLRPLHTGSRPRPTSRSSSTGSEHRSGGARDRLRSSTPRC